MLKSSNKKSKQIHSEKEKQPSKPVIQDLCDIFRQGVRLKESSQLQLSEQREKGLGFFNEWNEWRIRQAFESFSLSMRYALYEIIYLLHENYPKFEAWKYKIFRSDSKKKYRDEEEEELLTADLYVPGAPCGVKAINELSSRFKSEFETYVRATFGDPPDVLPKGVIPPIEGIYSIGSIGTIGHKNIASDLDLEVQYNLEPSLTDTKDWNDGLLKEVLQEEYKSLIQRYFQKKGIASVNQIPKDRLKKAYNFFGKTIREKYPLLYRHLLTGDVNIAKGIRRSNDLKMRYRLVMEITQLMKRYIADSAVTAEGKQKEELLKKRIGLIQDYVQTKFPEAELYLFPFSRSDFQKGYYGSTLDSKESSGGAYELILNYETLMPGIYFTPVVPSHFLFSQSVNNDNDLFEKYSSFIQFGLLEGFSDLQDNINFQGPTPDLDPLYVASHSAAAYWEAFKASSGNLPKAALNLLRFEMLLNPEMNRTVIQLIKDPTALDFLLKKGKEGFARVDELDYYFPPPKLVAFEESHERLRYDPWWLKYKTLKFSFGSPGLIPGISDEEAVQISNLLDLSFALHIQVADVFPVPGAQQNLKTTREKILASFLETVFPDDSDLKKSLYSIVIGDVQSVNKYELELRKIFLKSVQRIHAQVGDLNLDQQTTKEFDIWYYYFTKQFMPSANSIQKSILNHLQVPRGRLQIGFKQKQGWFFKSLQKGTAKAEGFDASILKLLPEEITLKEKTHFIDGLVYCVINRYLGIFNEGKLNQTKTVVELDRSITQLNSSLDNQLAFVRPDQLERVTVQIRNLFPDEKANFLDCIEGEQCIKEVMVFLNLIKYGHLAVLYRDNMKNIFVERTNLQNFTKNADKYIADYKLMLRTKSLHVALAKFFREKEVDLKKVKLKTWVNANSAATNHSSVNHAGKDRDLSLEFGETILQVHGRQ